jgi:hypothetical protein
MPDPTTQPTTETTATNTPPLDTTGAQQPSAPAPATTPTPVSNPTTVAPNTPHARLLNMIQGLAVGVDSFAKAAATHGREGGTAEVQDFYAKQQQAEAQQQKAQQESQEHDLRLKTMNANLLINQMSYQHAMQLFPTQQKEAQLKLQNDTIHEFVDEKTTGESMGYDMNDPAQATEARQRMGLGSAANQPGAIVVPFAAGQKTEDVTGAMTKALPPGASLTDYKIMPQYNDDKHGTGGTLTLVPNDAPIMTMGATPRQIGMAQAETEGALAKAKAIGLSDDPLVQRLQGQYDNMKSVIANGGKPSTGDLFTMHMGVNGPIAKLTADTNEANKLAAEKETAAKAARPANLDDAVSRLTAAQQTAKETPNAQTHKLLLDAQQYVTNFRANEVSKDYADATAKAQAGRDLEDNDLKLIAQQLVKPNNLTAITSIASMKGDQRIRLDAMATKLDPTYDPGVINNKIKFLGEYTDPNGRVAQNLVSYNTFMQHAGNLLDATGTYRNTSLPLLNAPLSSIRQKFGDATYNQYMATLQPVREEYNNMLAGGFSPKAEDAKAGHDILSDSASPAQVEAAVKQMGHTAIARADSVNDMYRKVMGTDDPDLISPAARAAAVKLGLGPEVSKFGSGGSINKPNTTQTKAAAPGGGKFDPTALPDAK